VLATPIGELLLRGDGEALVALDFADGRDVAVTEPDWRRDDAVFARARAQLQAYFAGELTDFELELAPRGTAFQLQVWHAVRAIPYGETSTYGVLAQQLGRPTAFRAVGAANGRNPISIIIPCHRVLGSDGGLTGYGGGMQRKEWLLAHEQRG
jgi:methylated-DNA-[protein]-cysteine S-methyltransferase